MAETKRKVLGGGGMTPDPKTGKMPKLNTGGAKIEARKRVGEKAAKRKY